MTEIRKPGQLGTCDHSDTPHEQGIVTHYAHCHGWKPLPQPETLENRAREIFDLLSSGQGHSESCRGCASNIAKVVDVLRLVEQENAQKWISVKERLPEHKQSVLVSREEYSPGMQQAKYFRQHSQGYPAGFYCGSVVEHVTHWMLLPSGPSSD